VVAARDAFATAAEPGRLIIDHQFVILPAGPLSREIYCITKRPGFRAHIHKQQSSTGHRHTRRRHKIVVAWSGIGNSRGETNEAS
jgi:hypothetical protein